MKTFQSSARFALLAALVLPFAAQAQPQRNANIYGGMDHQPDASVEGDEAAAGIAPSDKQQKALNQDVDQLGKQLLDKANEYGKTHPQSGSVYGTQPGGVVQIAPGSKP